MRIIVASMGVAALVASAYAGPNSFKVESLWSNTTGSFSSSQAYPNVTMTMSNQDRVTGGEQYGERYVAWLSGDNGATRFKVNGHADFKLEWDMKLTSDYRVEGGLLMNYFSHPGFQPTSQYFVSKNAVTGATAIATSQDWTMPSWDAVAAGAGYNLGDTVHMSFEHNWDPNGDANPMDSVSQLTFGTFKSGWINGNWGGPIFDDQLELGLYFQPIVGDNTGGPRNSEAVFNNVVLSAPEPGSMLALGLGALAMFRRRK